MARKALTEEALSCCITGSDTPGGWTSPFIVVDTERYSSYGSADTSLACDTWSTSRRPSETAQSRSTYTQPTDIVQDARHSDASSVSAEMSHLISAERESPLCNHLCLEDTDNLQYRDVQYRDKTGTKTTPETLTTTEHPVRPRLPSLITLSSKERRHCSSPQDIWQADAQEQEAWDTFGRCIASLEDIASLEQHISNSEFLLRLDHLRENYVVGRSGIGEDDCGFNLSCALYGIEAAHNLYEDWTWQLQEEDNSRVETHAEKPQTRPDTMDLDPVLLATLSTTPLSSALATMFPPDNNQMLLESRNGQSFTLGKEQDIAMMPHRRTSPRAFEPDHPTYRNSPKTCFTFATDSATDSLPFNTYSESALSDYTCSLDGNTLTVGIGAWAELCIGTHTSSTTQPAGAALEASTRIYDLASTSDVAHDDRSDCLHGLNGLGILNWQFNTSVKYDPSAIREPDIGLLNTCPGCTGSYRSR